MAAGLGKSFTVKEVNFTNAEEIKKLVNETARATLSLNPTENGWSCYFLLQKTKIEEKNFDDLTFKVCEFILKHRKERSVTEGSKKKGADKPFVLDYKA